MKFRQFLFIALLGIASCALPAPEYENQHFVPQKDIVANSLYAQGTVLYKAGRFIDSEMKFRQALFLFPDAHNIRSSLALVLKSSALYDESIAIYKDLEKRFPEVYEYKFALADTYYRMREYEMAEKYYRQAILGFEKDVDVLRPAQISRSLAAINFSLGKESQAFCDSLQAYGYMADQEQTTRHIKLLLAMGYYKQANEFISPYLENLTQLKDPSILKLGAITKFAIGDDEDAKKIMQLAVDHQSSLKVVEPELETLKEVFAYKFPEPVNLEEEEMEEEEPKEFIFNEQNTLYWPHNLLAAYYEYNQAKLQESES